MTRFRVLLVVVAVLTIAGVAYAELRPPAPSPVGGGPAATSADLFPVGERVSAPDFRGIDAWINSQPLSLRQLRGRVVLIDFWTFSCVNCIRTLPHLRSLYNAYRDRGFLLVGVHSPGFDFEKQRDNVAAAVQRLNVTWPVALDSEMATWRAYSNNFWPAEYLIDKDGKLAHRHYGEGDYAATQAAVSTLLGAPAASPSSPTPPQAQPGALTPEIYLGGARGRDYGLADNEAYQGFGVIATYPEAMPIEADHALLVGRWRDDGDEMTAVSAGPIRLLFHARDVFVVAGSNGGIKAIALTVDGRQVPTGHWGAALSSSGTVAVDRQDLYQLAVTLDAGDHLLDLSVPPGVQLYTFTFG